MGPIQATNLTTTGAPLSGATMMDRGSLRPNDGGTTSSLSSSSGMSSGTSSIENVAGMVTQMLRSVGQGLENDEVLRALVTLLIMLAILNETLSGARSPGEELSSLAGGLQGLGAGSGSSTFMIEYTSVTMTSTTITGTFGAADASQSDVGGRLDISG